MENQRAQQDLRQSRVQNQNRPLQQSQYGASNNLGQLIEQHQRSYQNFLEVALELIMQERDVKTSYGSGAEMQGAGRQPA